jgi:hypothetical protein
MAREQIIAPSWAIYAIASEHTNAGALADAEHRKREATIPAVFRIDNRVFVTCGAWWGGERDGAAHADLPRQLSVYEVRAALDTEQDDRSARGPDLFYAGRVFTSEMRRWRMLAPFDLLPPVAPRPAQLHQETLF